jgi:hypothetical protein
MINQICSQHTSRYNTHEEFEAGVLRRTGRGIEDEEYETG